MAHIENIVPSIGLGFDRHKNPALVVATIGALMVHISVVVKPSDNRVVMLPVLDHKVLKVKETKVGTWQMRVVSRGELPHTVQFSR